MKLLIITHTTHKKHNNQLFAYGPYVNEMRLWEKYVKKVHIVAPFSSEIPTAIELHYKNPNLQLTEVPAFSLTSWGHILKTILQLPGILWVVFKAMRKADHIHLRCPGNMGLLGCIVQVFFPKKRKSAKYAGNWDPKAKQPISYKLQKWILNNEFLTRNMQVLVYGDWEGLSKNCVPFFTVTYPENKKEKPNKNFELPYKVLFAGTLSKGKRPLYAVQLVKKIQEKGIEIKLNIYGEGECRNDLEEYIIQNNLTETVTLHGNQTAETLERAYKESHFLILPSKSEGWPKVVAEAMFWGLVPTATPVSCVPEMLGNGNRGVLLTLDTEIDSNAVQSLLKNKVKLQNMSQKAAQWSQQYTLEYFEKGIEKILNSKKFV